MRHAALGVAAVEIAAEEAVLLARRLRRAEAADEVALAFDTRRMIGVGRKRSTQTRTETQAMQNSQAGR